MFDKFMEELHNIKNQIITMYSPFKIILFGSLAKHDCCVGEPIGRPHSKILYLCDK